MGRAARAIVRTQAWKAFGYARIEDYGRERLGRCGRWLRDLAALDDALTALPELAGAMTGDDGREPLGRVATLMIGRIATTESVGRWIALARSITVRQLREEVRASRARGSAWPAGHDDEPQAESGEHTATDRVAAEPVAEQTAPSDNDPAGPLAGRTAPAESALEETVSEQDDGTERRLVALAVPRAVRASFHEAVELHRAVTGQEATVTSFIEALVAECLAGPHPPDVSMTMLGRAAPRAVIENALARATERWASLAAATDTPNQLAASPLTRAIESATRTVESIERLEGAVVPGEAEDPDSRIRSLIHLEEEIDLRLGQLLAEMGNRGAWTRLMFAGLGHYADQRLGIPRTTAQQKTALARGAREFPLLWEACESGRIGSTAASLICRALGRDLARLPALVDPGVQRAWVERAEEATIKRLRDELRLLGWVADTTETTETADTAKTAETAETADMAYTHEMTETAAMTSNLNSINGRSLSSIARITAQLTSHSPTLASTAQSKLDSLASAACSGSSGAVLPVDDALWHAALRRAPGDALMRVRRLSGATAEVVAHSRAIDSAPNVFLRLRLPEQVASDLLAAVESSRRALAARVDSVPWQEPWPEPDAAGSVLVAKAFSDRCRRVPAWVGLLAMIEDYVATWDDPAASPRRAADATYIRDGWRCTAPGCTSRRNLEDHHIVYRSHGGGNERSNRTTLCRFHHQMGEHGGLASCRGDAPLGIVWRLGRHGMGGRFVNERRLTAAAG